MSLIVIVAGVDSVEDSAEVEGEVRMEAEMEVMMEELPEEASEVAGPREEALTSLHLVAELSEAEAVEAEDSQLSVQAATSSTGGRLRSWSLGSRPGKRRR